MGRCVWRLSSLRICSGLPPNRKPLPEVSTLPELFAQQFAGLDGFLGTRAALMTDIVFLALFAIVPTMLWSIVMVRGQGKTDDSKLLLHKRVQTTLGLILLVAIILFEIDVRFISDWEQRAAASPYSLAVGWSIVWISLAIHLLFAIPTLFLWIYVIVMALRKFDSLPRPNAYSATHRLTARMAAVGMTMTAVTGWIFYYLAFVA